MRPVTLFHQRIEHTVILVHEFELLNGGELKLFASTKIALELPAVTLQALITLMRLDVLYEYITQYYLDRKAQSH